MNEMVMDSMHTTSWKFWVVFAILSAIVAYGLVYTWARMIMMVWGSPASTALYWGIFLVNTVFWIGISHAGTFISAILRVFKAEFRRPFTRAAELMTTFGLVQAGSVSHAHGARLAGLLAVPVREPAHVVAEPAFAPFLGSPGDHHLFVVLHHVPVPAVDPGRRHGTRRSTGWRKILYKILALDFGAPRGMDPPAQRDEHLRFRDHPGHVLGAHDRLVGFAVARAPAGIHHLRPVFRGGCSAFGMGAVIMVLAIVRGTMKHEVLHPPRAFRSHRKLMLIISMAWAYFFFNDYMVQWYGGDKWTKQLLHFHEGGPASAGCGFAC